MSTATVTSKGQITIPVSVRQKLGLDVGDRVEFVEIASGEFLIKSANYDVSLLKGMLKRPEVPVSTAKMREAIRNRASGKK